MKKEAKECSSKAAEVDKSFSEWLGYIKELHQCCVAKETSNEKQRAANATEMAAKQAQQTANKDTVAAAKKTMNELDGTLEVAREAYKKSSDEFPKGMLLQANRWRGSEYT